MTEQQLFEFYQEKFKPIYADLVAVTATKHLEVDGQIESAMSHLAVGKTATDAATAQRHIDASFAHLCRASLDAAKLLWLDRNTKVRQIMRNEMTRKWCTNVSEGELFRLHGIAENLVRDARRKDVQNAGEDARELVEGYFQAAIACQNIIDCVDDSKVVQAEPWRLWYLVKQQTMGFLVGVASSLLVTVFAWKYLPPTDSQAAPTPRAVNLAPVPRAP